MRRIIFSFLIYIVELINKKYYNIIKKVEVNYAQKKERK